MKTASFLSFFIGIIFIVLPYGYQMIGLVFLFLAIILHLSSHRKLVGCVLAIVCPLVLFLEIPIIQAAYTDAPDDVDYLILLGAGVNGTTPSFDIIENETKKETAAPVVAVVSSEYHLYRAKYIAQKLGSPVYGIAAPTSNWLLKINYFLREAPAVVKAWLTPV